MKIIRWILARIILFVDRWFGPRLQRHAPETQARLDAQTAHMTLYQYAACPFCVKVRWVAQRLGLDIAVRDAKNNPDHRAELLEGGGKIQVPCLRIATPGADQWLYESSAIIRYLEQLVANDGRVAQGM